MRENFYEKDMRSYAFVPEICAANSVQREHDVSLQRNFSMIKVKVVTARSLFPLFSCSGILVNAPEVIWLVYYIGDHFKGVVRSKVSRKAKQTLLISDVGEQSTNQIHHGKMC